jgi:hypothetical protein
VFTLPVDQIDPKYQFAVMNNYRAVRSLIEGLQELGFASFRSRHSECPVRNHQCFLAAGMSDLLLKLDTQIKIADFVSGKKLSIAADMPLSKSEWTLCKLVREMRAVVAHPLEKDAEENHRVSFKEFYLSSNITIGKGAAVIIENEFGEKTDFGCKYHDDIAYNFGDMVFLLKRHGEVAAKESWERILPSLDSAQSGPLKYYLDQLNV